MLTIALLPLALSAASLQDQPDAEKIFGDWAVACDNNKRCEATALVPMEWLGEDDGGPTQMMITHDAGPVAGFTIDVRPAEEKPGAFDVAIDGKQVAAGKTTAYQAYADEGIALLPALANGKELTLMAGGKRVGRVSLAGLAATLRYMDAVQGRAGTVTALVAKGDKPASAVPAAPAMPRITVLHPPAGEAAAPAQIVINTMMTAGECESEVELKPEFHPLDGAATLALIPCGSGAYNYNSAVFVLRGGKAEPAKFDVQPGWMEGSAGPALATNASWDEKNGLLHHFDKGRGLGDCGTAMTWGWDGTRFRLIEAARLEECRGSIEWPTVFVADPVWKN